MVENVLKMDSDTIAQMYIFTSHSVFCVFALILFVLNLYFDYFANLREIKEKYSNLINGLGFANINLEKIFKSTVLGRDFF